MDSDLKIRPMTKSDFQLMVNWGNKESWSEITHDCAPFFAIDPAGFFAGQINEETVSTVSGVRYGNYAHIGIYICKSDQRKKRYGLTVFERAMDHVKEAKCIGLDAVEAQVPNYEKWGFRVHEKTCRFIRKAAEGKYGPNLVDLRKVPLEDLVEYDQKIFGDSRKSFLEALLQEDYVAVGMIKEGRLVGYGILRRDEEYCKIGPFLADDKSVAEEILNGLQSQVSGRDVLIDIFESNTTAQKILEDQRWTYLFPFYRMYAKSLPSTDTSKVYAPVIEVG